MRGAEGLITKKFPQFWIMNFSILSNQFLIFIIVGFLTALIDILSVLILENLNINYRICIVFGFLLSVLVNFYLHSMVTFGVKCSHHIFTKFIIVVIINLILTFILVEILIFLEVKLIISKIICLPIIAINGFLLSKYWIFKK